MSVHDYTCTCCHTVNRKRCLFIKFKQDKYNSENHNAEASLLYQYVSPYNREFIYRICDLHLLLTSCMSCKCNMLTQTNILDPDKCVGNRLVQKIEVGNPQVKQYIVCDKCFKKSTISILFLVLLVERQILEGKWSLIGTKVIMM